MAKVGMDFRREAIWEGDTIPSLVLLPEMAVAVEESALGISSAA